MVFNATFNNISAISWRSVLLVEETGVPRENQHTCSTQCNNPKLFSNERMIFSNYVKILYALHMTVHVTCVNKPVFIQVQSITCMSNV
jgi:hypothetical protein